MDPQAAIELQYPAGRRGVPAPRRIRGWVSAVLHAEHAYAEHAGAGPYSMAPAAAVPGRPTGIRPVCIRPACIRPVCIRFVDALESQRLNHQYRDRDRPTNVLSFPQQIPPGLPPQALSALSLGDLAICIPVVRREAAEQHKSVTHHYAHMIVHGLLHLLGYDHIEEADALRMEARERQLLAGFGIADPYAGRAGF